MARTRQKNHIEIEFTNNPIGMGINKSQPGARTPMPKKTLLDIGLRQRALQQWIVAQVDHARSKVVTGAPKSVD